MKIDTAILATDGHDNYFPFWEYCARSWTRIGIGPLLYFIDNGSGHDIDTKVGDVIRFDAIPNIDTAFQAQIIRLLVPALYPNETIVIADIDSFPLSRSFFQSNIVRYESDSFVSFRPDAGPAGQIPMMWNVARGSTWAEIFQIDSLEEAERRLTEWWSDGYRPVHDGLVPEWFTDQIMLYRHVEAWRKTAGHRFVGLNDEKTGFYRLDRTANNPTHTTRFEQGRFYSDYCPNRPLHEHRTEIEGVLRAYGIL